MTPSTRRPAGLLLTGGRSTRMGQDKAGLLFAGEPLAARIGRMLATVALPALEVGGGWSGLATATEKEPYEGPLTAVVAGWRSLKALGYDGDALVVATDLPWLTVEALAWLADYPAAGSVVPVVDDRAQPLCARWCRKDLERALLLADQGERKVKPALGADATYPTQDLWVVIGSPDVFRDADRPEDLHLHRTPQRP
jgi:molybdopterin-guanine dinucleotide biosynthesis protein A